MVVNVDWEDAKEFCIWLTQKELKDGTISKGQVYRLPTDAEWSLAAGAGKEPGQTAEKKNWSVDLATLANRDKRPGGRPMDSSDTDVAGNYAGKGDGFQFTAPVGSFPPNEYGLYDMLGNAWEWCVDFADDGRRHILRGGSWANQRVTLGTRDFTLPDNLIGNCGFRCVLADSDGHP